MRTTVGTIRKLVKEAMTWEEMSLKDQLLSDYSDIYKEKYGIRPRGDIEAMQAWPEEAIQAALDRLYDEPGVQDDLPLEAPPADDMNDFPPIGAEYDPKYDKMRKNLGMGRRTK